MSTLTYHLNRLAGTLVNGNCTASDVAAANLWAGTSGRSLVEAINIKAGLTGRTITECLNLLASGGGGGGSPQNLFTSQTPALPDVNEAAPVTVGITFTVSSNCSCTGGRFYGPATIGAGTYDLALWEITADDNPAGTGTGTLLATASFSSPLASTWNTATFASAQSLVTTKAYRIGLRTSAGRYAATGGFFTASGLTNGIITAPQNGATFGALGQLDNGNFTSGLVNYPNSTFGGNAYFVDPTVTTGGGGTGTTNNKYTALDAISRIP